MATEQQPPQDVLSKCIEDMNAMEKRKREESEEKEEQGAKRQKLQCPTACVPVFDEQKDLDLLTDVDDDNEKEAQHLDLVEQVKQRHVRLQHTSYILSRMLYAITQEELYLTTAAHTDDEMQRLLASPFATHLKLFLPAIDKEHAEVVEYMEMKGILLKKQ